MRTLMSLLIALGVMSDAPLKPGDKAPDFELPATNGETLTLAQYKDQKSVVLAFFPKAFTGGWTKEMTAFGEQNSSFTGKNAQVLGISMDDLETQKRFAESLKSPFPLLADPSGEVAKAYGVHGGDYAKRVTFVIGKDGKIVEVISGRDAIDPAGALNACSRAQ